MKGIDTRVVQRIRVYFLCIGGNGRSPMKGIDTSTTFFTEVVNFVGGNGRSPMKGIDTPLRTSSINFSGWKWEEPDEGH